MVRWPVIFFIAVPLVCFGSEIYVSIAQYNEDSVARKFIGGEVFYAREFGNWAFEYEFLYEKELSVDGQLALEISDAFFLHRSEESDFLVGINQASYSNGDVFRILDLHDRRYNASWLEDHEGEPSIYYRRYTSDRGEYSIQAFYDDALLEYSRNLNEMSGFRTSIVNEDDYLSNFGIYQAYNYYGDVCDFTGTGYLGESRALALQSKISNSGPLIELGSGTQYIAGFGINCFIKKISLRSEGVLALGSQDDKYLMVGGDYRLDPFVSSYGSLLLSTEALFLGYDTSFRFWGAGASLNYSLIGHDLTEFNVSGLFNNIDNYSYVKASVDLSLIDEVRLEIGVSKYQDEGGFPSFGQEIVLSNILKGSEGYYLTINYSY